MPFQPRPTVAFKRAAMRRSMRWTACAATAGKAVLIAAAAGVVMLGLAALLLQLRRRD